MSLIDNLKNAIENRISSLISSHNTNSNAHSSILSTVAKTGDYTDLSNKPAVDSALSTISSNAIQNQTVTNALNNKSNSDHNHNDVYYTENEVDGLISAHNTNSNAHSSLFSGKVNKSDIVDNLTTSNPYKPLSAQQGKVLKDMIEAMLYVGSVSLVSDKSVLSSYDGESTVLTATVLDDQNNPVRGVGVTFYKGLTSLGTVVTNSSGVATKTYNSVGDGLVVFSAEAKTVTSNDVQITDYLYIDTTTTDHTNRYSIISTPDFYQGSITYDSTNEEYTITASSINNNIAGYSVINLDGLSDFNITMDFKIVSTSNNRQIGIGALNTANNVAIAGRYESINKLTIWRNDGGSSFIDVSQSLSNNTYYKMQFIKQGNDYTLRVYNINGTLIKEGKGTSNVFDSVSTLKPYIYVGFTQNSTFKFRNLKIY